MGNLHPFTRKEISPLLEEKIRDATVKHHLRCGQLHLKSIPDILLEESQFTELLKTADFSGNLLQYFPHVHLPKVTDINFWGNNMTDQMFSPYRKNGKLGKSKMKNSHTVMDFDELNPQLDDIHSKLGCFSMMPVLENLDLGNNQLSVIPPSLSFAKNLDQLHLMGNNLSDSNSLYAIFNLVKISYLDLNYNKFNKFPINSLSNKPKLYTLLLQGNKITSIPSSLNLLTSLQKLNLADNCIDTVEEGAFDNLTLMKNFFLFNNQISSFPDDSFKHFESLNQLILSSNHLTSLPSSITCLVNLRLLNASENRIEELPINLQGMNNLTELNLSYNFIRKLPLSIGYLTELRTLHLSYNNLKNLPITFGYLLNLSTLSLIGNKFSDPGDSSPFLLPPFNSDDFLSLINNNNNNEDDNDKGHSNGNNNIEIIESEDNDSKKKKKKKKADIVDHKSMNNNNNDIKEKYEVGLKPIWSLTKMEELDLSFNQLSHLPTNAFEQLHSLTKLCLSYNHLPSIPLLYFDDNDDDENNNNKSRGCMIECVFLNGNLMKEFPHMQLYPLRNSLRKLSIDGNPILSIPPEIEEYKALTQLVVSIPPSDHPSKHSKKHKRKKEKKEENNNNNNNSKEEEVEEEKGSKGGAGKFFPPDIHSLNLKRLLVGNYFDKELEEIGLQKDMELQGTDALLHPAYPSFSASSDAVGKLDHHYPFGFAVTKGTSSHPIEDCVSLHSLHFHFPSSKQNKEGGGGGGEEEVTVQFAGVFDGHGGNDVSLFLQSKLHHYFEEKIQSLSDNPFLLDHPSSLSTLYSLFSLIFSEANEDIYSTLEQEDKLKTPMGSTGVVVLISNDVMYCINAGDSRAILATSSPSLRLLPYPHDKSLDPLLVDNDGNSIKSSDHSNSHLLIDNDVFSSLDQIFQYPSNHLQSNWKVLRLSVDHKPHLHVEVEKIRERKAFVMPDASGSKGARLGVVSGPAVAVSRAFGDFYLGNGITSSPHLLSYQLDPSHDLFIIMGSDGVWDVINDAHAIQFALMIFNLHLPLIQSPSLICSIVASRLRDLVISLGSGDDISVVVVPLPALVNVLQKGGGGGGMEGNVNNPFSKPSSRTTPPSSSKASSRTKRKKKRSKSSLKKKPSSTSSSLKHSVNF